MSDLSSLTPLANHLWQSTIFVGVIWLLTRAFKKNRAAVRYWLWFAASVKFLLPFSFLVALGSRLSWRSGAPIAQPQWSFVVDNAIQPFAASTAPPQIVSQHVSFPLVPILIAVWLCGATVGLVFWLKCWLQMRCIRKNATPLSLGLPIPVLLSPSRIEPGVFGIFRPVLLLPDGIESRLTPAQLDAIVAHEMAHVRRRDNLTAAIHMIVEIIFWFFPVVWWLRARLIGERENACDEAVLRMGNKPHDYAESILRVCELYMESPLTCVSGVSGAGIQKRIRAIVAGRAPLKLNITKATLLIHVSVGALVLPIIVGTNGARSVRAQSDEINQVVATPQFHVDSIRLCSRDISPSTYFAVSGPGAAPGTLVVPCASVMTMIREAYLDYSGGRYHPFPPASTVAIQNAPNWLQSDGYNLVAEAEASPGPDVMKGPVLQAILENRFRLKIRRETRDVAAYALTVAPGGPKLCPAGKDEGAEFGAQCYGEWFGKSNSADVHIVGSHVTAKELSERLSEYIDDSHRFVIDETGLAGRFDVFLVFAPSDEAYRVQYAKFHGWPTPNPNAPPLTSAIKEQLGLQLNPTTALGEVLIVDHVERPS